MNRILLEPTDFTGPDRARLTGRRFRHVTETLRSQVGDVLRIGSVNGPLGSGTVVALGPDSLDLAVAWEGEPPPPRPVTLILALPRPKVLRRLVADVTSLGVARLILLETWRVEKSYWQTPALEDEALRRAMILGLEQSGATTLPRLDLRRRFKPFVEDELPDVAGTGRRLVAHPREAEPCPSRLTQPLTLAIGPEGGFTEYEVDQLVSRGFEPVTLGPRILRVETAVAALLGRLL